MSEEPTPYAADPAAIAREHALTALQMALEQVSPPVKNEKGAPDRRDRTACMCVVPSSAVRVAIEALLQRAEDGDPLVTTAARKLRQYMTKASFAAAGDRRAAANCLDVLEAAALRHAPGDEPMRSAP